MKTNQNIDGETSAGTSPLESESSYPICEHIKDDGVRCGSPALKHRSLCYFHYRNYTHIMPINHIDYELPVLDSEESVQIAIRQVMQALLRDEITEKRAHIVLNAIRLSAQSLRQRCVSGPEKVETDFTSHMRQHLAVDYFSPLEMTGADNSRSTGSARENDALLDQLEQVSAQPPVGGIN